MPKAKKPAKKPEKKPAKKTAKKTAKKPVNKKKGHCGQKTCGPKDKEDQETASKNQDKCKERIVRESGSNGAGNSCCSKDCILQS